MVITLTADGRGTVSEGAGDEETRILDPKYPYEVGLSGGSTKQIEKPYLREVGLNE